MSSRKRIEVKIFVNPSLFIFKDVDNEDKSKLLKLEVDLQKYAHKFKRNSGKVENSIPAIGKVILAFDSELKKWYRVKVLQIIDKSNASVKIRGLALDYGVIDTVKLKHTIPLEEHALVSSDIGLFSVGGLYNVIPAKYVSVNSVFVFF